MIDIAYRLYLGDAAETLASFADASVDAMVCDPPAGISFMGKTWDHDHGGRENWVRAFAAIFRECLRVLKPGAHALVWALPRTSHWTASALEDAGFEIRDVVTHLQSQGFPKSLNIMKQLAKTHGSSVDVSAGLGTALKPSSEHWILARSPLGERTVAANVLQHGTGALNIDGCRVGANPGYRYPNGAGGNGFHGGPGRDPDGSRIDPVESSQGRWPTNLMLSHDPACRRVGENKSKGSASSRYGTDDGGSSLFASGKRGNRKTTSVVVDSDGLETVEAWECVEGCPVAELDRQAGECCSAGAYPSDAVSENSIFHGLRIQGPLYADSGGASRFFYHAKASNSEKWFFCQDCGDAFQVRLQADHQHDYADKAHLVRHPTPKSIGLMRYLVRLITPPQGVVIDPFMGTGSTGIACLQEGFRFIGIEREREYMRIAKRRLMAETAE